MCYKVSLVKFPLIWLSQMNCHNWIFKDFDLIYSFFRGAVLTERERNELNDQGIHILNTKAIGYSSLHKYRGRNYDEHRKVAKFNFNSHATKKITRSPLIRAGPMGPRILIPRTYHVMNTRLIAHSKRSWNIKSNFHFRFQFPVKAVFKICLELNFRGSPLKHFSFMKWFSTQKMKI